MQSFVFLGLLVFELEPMYATSDRQTDGRTDRRTTDADDRITETQLSQRGRAMLRVTEYFAKSLKVIQGNSI